MFTWFKDNRKRLNWDDVEIWAKEIKHEPGYEWVTEIFGDEDNNKAEIVEEFFVQEEKFDISMILKDEENIMLADIDMGDYWIDDLYGDSDKFHQFLWIHTARIDWPIFWMWLKYTKGDPEMKWL